MAVRWLGGSSGFQFNDYDNWNSNSNVSSHLCWIIKAVTDLASWQKITSGI